MYAIVQIGGQQYKVEQGQELLVDRIKGKEGSTIELDNVRFVAEIVIAEAFRLPLK
jgi:large subunit ribosomal protein L21